MKRNNIQHTQNQGMCLRNKGNLYKNKKILIKSSLIVFSSLAFNIIIYQYDIFSSIQFNLFIDNKFKSLIMKQIESMKHFLSFNATLIYFLLLSVAVRINGKAPVWLANPDIQADSYQLMGRDQTSLIAKAQYSTITPISFTRAFQETPRLAFGISTFQTLGHKQNRCFQLIKTDLINSKFSMKVLISCLSDIWLLQIRYFAISSSFHHHLNIFENVPINYENGALVNISQLNSSPRQYRNFINYTQQAKNIGSKYIRFSTPFSNNKVALFITTFITIDKTVSQFQANNNINLTVKSEALNQTHYVKQVMLVGSISIANLSFTIIIFDRYDIQLSGSYVIQSQTISFFNGITLLPFKPQFYDNLLFGFLSWSSTQKKLFNFDMKIPKNYLSLIPQPKTPPLLPSTQIYQFNLLYFKTWVCPESTFLDFNSQACVPCSIKRCQYCLNSTHCASQTNQKYTPLRSNKLILHQKRILVTATCLVIGCKNCCPNDPLKCQACDTNYFIVSGDRSKCVPCTLSNCLVCSSLTSCSTCNTSNSYFKNGSTCSYCNPLQNKFISPGTQNCVACTLSNCITCASLTTCSVCNTNNSYYLNGSACVLCNPSLNNFINSTTLSCQKCTLSDCLTCSSLTACSICNTSASYYINGATCSFCDSSLNNFINSTTLGCISCSIAGCITCVSLSNCSSCNLTDGYILNTTTGLCQQCGPGLFRNASDSLCYPCSLTQCVRCSSQVVCSICNTSNSFFLNGTTCSFCDPASNVFINPATSNCQPCQVSKCLNCSTFSQCSVCDASLQYFLGTLDNLCYPCSIVGCITCISLSNCSSCNLTDGYILNTTTGLCQQCGPGLFRNASDSLCYPCSLTQCVRCSSQVVCSICNTSNSFFLNGTTCSLCDSSLNTFVSSITLDCQKCTLDNCLNCTSLTACSACNTSNSFFLFNSSCVYCDPLLQNFINSTDNFCYPCSIANCLICSSLYKCLSCNQSAGFFLNSSTHQCQLCLISNCLQCSSLTSCFRCDETNNFGIDFTSPNHSLCGPCNVSCSCDGYTTPWISEILECTPICGDGLIRLEQQCDDNNTDSGDGCSSLCTIQQYFICDQAEPTTCNQTLFIQAELISILPYSCNEFKISVQLTPKLSTSQIISTISFFNSGIIVKDVLQNNGAIQIVAQYIKDIANQTIKLKFTPGVLLYITYTPEIPALRYTEAECKATESTYVFFQAVQITSYIVLLFSLISCKIVGLELFGVLQLSYFTLSMQDFFVLYLAPLAKFRTFNGLNIQFTKQQTPLPTNFTRLSVASSFTNNCNIMLILLFGQLIVSIVLYIIAKTTNRDKLRKVALRMLKQGFITLVIFNIFNISYSAGVHWKYASAADDGYILSSIILYGTLIAAIVATFAMCITDADDYGEFKNKFKHVWICRAYIPLTILYRAILGFYTAVQSDYSQGTLLIVGFAIAFMMYNIVNFPFYNTLQNYRATFVHITMLYTLLASNYYAGMKMNTPLEIKGRQYTVAIIELVLIVITLVMSSITLCYEIYQILKQCKVMNRIDNQNKNLTEQSLQAL